VNAEEPFGGRILVADSTVWAKLPKAPAEVQESVQRAIKAGQIRGSTIVTMELLRGTSDREAFERRRAQMDSLLVLPVTRTVCERAIGCLVELATTGSPGNHRVDLGDLLITATAADSGCDVLHYDGDFDKLAPAMDCESVWFARRGSI